MRKSFKLAWVEIHGHTQRIEESTSSTSLEEAVSSIESRAKDDAAFVFGQVLTEDGFVVANIPKNGSAYVLPAFA